MLTVKLHKGNGIVLSLLSEENTIQLLLSDSTPLNITEVNSIPPLHWACVMGYTRLIKPLLKRGANINEKASHAFGNTPLHLACNRGNLEVAKSLIENDADLNVRDSYRRTPLSCAIYTNSIEIVKLLIREEVSTESIDSHGYNALELSVYFGSKELTELLFSIGIEVSEEIRDYIVSLFGTTKSEWTISNHYNFPRKRRKSIKSLFLMTKKQCIINELSKDTLLEICKHM